MAGGAVLDLVSQENFSGGMFREHASELMPANGCWDITNGLLNEEGIIFRRGGVVKTAALAGSGGVVMAWAGYLGVGTAFKAYVLVGFANGRVYQYVEGVASLVTTGGPNDGVPYTLVSMNGKVWFPNSHGGATLAHTYDGTTFAEAAFQAVHYAVAGNRLLFTLAEDRNVGFTHVNEPGVNTATDFHGIAGGVLTTGLFGLRGSCLVFTTRGIWVISGLEKELTDAEGNVQQTLDLRAPELQLWGIAGVAAWQGGVLVPCRDGVWFLELGVTSEPVAPFRMVSSAIVLLYQKYVALGYKPGGATVARGHYFLPILGASGEPIDVLVCKLGSTGSQGVLTFPWTHLAGLGAGVGAYATDVLGELVGGTAFGLEAALLACKYFDPAVGLDQNNVGFTFNIQTHSIATGSAQRNLVAKAKVRYTLSSPGTSSIFAELSEQPEQPRVLLEGEAPLDEYGSTPFDFPVRKKMRFVSLRLALRQASSEVPAEVTIRSIALYVRRDGRI